MTCKNCEHWQQDKYIEFIGNCEKLKMSKSKFELCEKFSDKKVNDLFDVIFNGANNQNGL